MRPFTHARASTLHDAIAALAAPGARAIAGGTNLVDLMKGGIEAPRHLVDLNRLEGLDAVEPLTNGGLQIGALARNSDVAYAEPIARGYAMLSQAILAGASAQLRNMATVGGNLMQRTRCPYFVDLTARCNKRVPESGCDAMDGLNRMNAIVGTSHKCIAAHPSDMAVALAALDATIEIAGPEGPRSVPLLDFHVQPDDHPDHETVLRAQELITAVVLPPPAVAVSSYTKVRDRTSYAFALVSVAAGVTLDTEGLIAAARIAFGGIGTKPWRAFESEAMLVGERPTSALFRAAAEPVIRDAVPRAHNAFKVELARRALTLALSRLTQETAA